MVKPRDWSGHDGRFRETAPYMNSQESILVSKAREGDADAFGRLVQMYKAPLHAYIFSRLGDFDWAEDLAQETFVLAYRYLPRLREAVKLAPWLRGIADNLCSLWLRKLP